MAGIGVTAASAATPLSVTTTSPLPLAPLNHPLQHHSGCNRWDRELHLERGHRVNVAQLAEPGFHDRRALSGTPTANATATFAVTVTDSASPADTATSGQLTLYAGNGGERAVLAQHDLRLLDGAVDTDRGLAALPAPDDHHAHRPGRSADRCHHRSNAELACPGRCVQQGVWRMYQLPHDRGRPGYGYRSDQLEW